MNDTTQWIIVGIAVLGFVFNTGILWNEVQHLKKSVEKLWTKIDEMQKYILERDKK